MSAAHAAHIVAIGAAFADPKTEQLLVEPVTEINNRMVASSLDVAAFWQRYLREVMIDTEQSVACAEALLAAGCSELQLEQISRAVRGRLVDARSLFLKKFPKLVDQLQLRSRPIRDQWDTFGTGLLREVGQQIWGEQPPKRWSPTRIDALVVQPIRGGDGGYDTERKRIWVEAMLTDADPRIPEIMRVAWLITRLTIDAYIRDEADDALAGSWSLISLPLVLEAGRELEILREPELPICQAANLWRFCDESTARTLQRWWEQYRDTSMPLPAALKILQANT
ncbi:MAG: hypothetical protein VYA84_11445 [Planctomycetota bacterium]|nr:hypothetical protein [Planctomycetota bacterium]